MTKKKNTKRNHSSTEPTRGKRYKGFAFGPVEKTVVDGGARPAGGFPACTLEGCRATAGTSEERSGMPYMQNKEIIGRISSELFEVLSLLNIRRGMNRNLNACCHK